MSIELLSFTDGKEGIAKAASFLCSDHLKNDSDGCGRTETLFTEANMTKALKAVGVLIVFIRVLYFHFKPILLTFVHFNIGARMLISLKIP